MKAKHIPRIDIHDRIELKNSLPLRTPYVIYIDPCESLTLSGKNAESLDAILTLRFNVRNVFSFIEISNKL